MIDFVTAIRSRRNGGVDVHVIPAITGIGIDIDIDIIDCRTVADSVAVIDGTAAAAAAAVVVVVSTITR